MKVLVIGAAGGFGGQVARELLSKGHSVRALMRPGGRRPQLEAAEVVEGDALDLEALDRAASGVDAIVWGFHVPYTQWLPTAVTAARVTAEVAARHGATVLFPGNVYPLGPSTSGPIDETAPHRPPSRLGEIRSEIEGLFEQSCQRGARVIIVRAGDYLGPLASNSWFEMMTARALRGAAIVDPGGHGVPHAWAYLPDVARAGVALLERRAQLAAFEVFHFAGFTLDADGMLDAIRRGLGDPARRTLRVPFWLLRALSPLSAMLRAVLSMRYLWNEPVVLDDTKLRAMLPEFRATGLDQAVTETLHAMAQARAVKLQPMAAAKATAS